VPYSRNIKTSAGALTNLPIRARWFPRMWDVALRGNSSGTSPALLLGVRLWRSFWSFSAPPRDLHIPYFAMGARHTRENCATCLGIEGELTKVAGRRCAAWLKAKTDQENIRLVETQNYVPPQTAFYAHWLLFEMEAAFLEFLEAFPHCGLDARLAKTAEERDALAADLDRRRVRRDFDLSRVGDEQQRTNLARRYVETTDKIRQLDAHLRLLETSKRLAADWSDKL
jgi:hypothetical protein